MCQEKKDLESRLHEGTDTTWALRTSFLTSTLAEAQLKGGEHNLKSAENKRNEGTVYVVCTLEHSS